MGEIETPSTPKNEKPIITRKQFLQRGALALLATALGVEIADAVKNKNEVLLTFNTISFYTELLKRGTYHGPLCFEVFQGKGIGGIPSWSDKEKSDLDLQIESTKETLWQYFGEPLPWTENLKVLVLKSKNQVIGKGVETAGGYGTFRLPGVRDNLRILPMFAGPDHKEFVKILTHEMTHTWDDHVTSPIPLSWQEGIACLPDMIWLSEQGQLDHQRIYGHYFSEYVTLNKPNLRDINWHEDTIPNRLLAYFMASSAMFMLWQESPSFFKDLYNKEREFFAGTGRRPGLNEIVTLGNQVEPDFSDWAAKQQILQNPQLNK